MAGFKHIGARHLFNKVRMRRAFTLVEILIVVAIIATLAAIAIPNLRTYYYTTQAKSCEATIKRIGRASSSYWARYGKPPEAISDLVEPAAPFLKGYPKCSYGGEYEIKPNEKYGFVVTCTAHDPVLHNVNAQEDDESN